MCLFVRNLTSQEGQRLQQIIRRGNSVVTVRRAEIVLGSAQGIRVPAIAENLHCHADHVRDVIHRFNEAGLDSLKPQWGGGRPAKFTAEHRSALVELALIPPRVIGLPFTQWSLTKLREALIGRKIVKDISIETIRVILDQAGISYQQTKTWKESNDPDFEAKKNESSSSTTRRPKTGE